MKLSTTQLSIRYGKSAPVIEDLTHDFASSAVTALIGPSGSGKSTLLYTLALMLTPAGGHVLWNDSVTSTLTDSDRARLRSRYSGFVFQDAVLDLAQTALDNVLEASWIAGEVGDQPREHALALMERFGVAELASKRPGQVSGGQAQRIALCRALVRKPQVLFADEPTGNLDPVSADVVWNALRQAASEGATVIVATHDHARARSMDHVLDLGRRLEAV